MLNTRLDKEQARSIGLSCRQSEIIYATFLQPPESCESSVRNTSALDFKTRFALSLSLSLLFGALTHLMTGKGKTGR